MDEIKEFNIDMVVYSETNEYTADEISEMFVDWVESKNIFCGGSVALIKERLEIKKITGWNYFNERPKDGSEIRVMWSDDSVDDLTYTKESFGEIDFRLLLIPIKWQYIN